MVKKIKEKHINWNPIEVKQEILNLLKEKSCSRKDFELALGMHRTTIYDYLIKLLMEKKVFKTYQLSKSRGRPTTIWNIKRS